VSEVLAITGLRLGGRELQRIEGKVHGKRSERLEKSVSCIIIACSYAVRSLWAKQGEGVVRPVPRLHWSRAGARVKVGPAECGILPMKCVIRREHLRGHLVNVYNTTFNSFF
jgi:hypothetical protein